MLAVVLAIASAYAHAQGADTLPSWSAGASKARIVGFVQAVTAPGSPEFVPEAERIAVFDNDGTLWSEKPVNFQLLFAIDEVRRMAPDHPEWTDQQPFRAVLEGNMEALMASGEEGLIKIVMASHAGMTTEQFNRRARAWLETARHPRFDRPYTELVFQPMLELMDYLRANGFRTFIVSGGGIDMVRLFSEEVYGIPPDQVVGSQINKRFEVRDGDPVIVREPGLFFIDDKAGKPIGIDNHIGRRPFAAFGNSDGDLQMLEWTAGGAGERLIMIVHHTDAEREWAYDRESHVGRLDKALDEARENNWLVVDMASDWKVIYPVQLEP